MELYFFNQVKDYGYQYIIMSDSKERALEELKKYLFSQINDDNEPDKDDYYHRNIYNKWEDSSIDNLPEEYSIQIFKPNEVIETYYG